MTETHEHRIKRLKIRSWRRGTKEMDMILGPYSDTEIANLTIDDLEKYESFLVENDQDLYVWMTLRENPPEKHRDIIDIIRNFHKIT